jgi:hypothetical protein
MMTMTIDEAKDEILDQLFSLDEEGEILRIHRENRNAMHFRGLIKLNDPVMQKAFNGNVVSFRYEADQESLPLYLAIEK